ncbi:hypothetical protein ACFS6H_17940 [Terrimonas rubra]|uniref:Uncharacterized protein n=1 Tax=Terrimonas rubra TaxID=1035890 RepID=A0ABW6AB23_9BACT
MWDIDKGDKTTDIEAKCPQCCELMANMGLDFAAPKKEAVREWKHIENLYTVGISFHSCGCSGPGYIPRSTEQLIEYFNDTLQDYHTQLKFWQNRTEPGNKKEIDREKSKNEDFLWRVPVERNSEKGIILNEDAKKYWLGRIREVEEKLSIIKSQAI